MANQKNISSEPEKEKRKKNKKSRKVSSDLGDADRGKKIKDLKIELLKQPQKRKSIKREIARLLTLETSLKKDEKEKSSAKTKLGEKL